MITSHHITRHCCESSNQIITLTGDGGYSGTDGATATVADDVEVSAGGTTDMSTWLTTTALSCMSAPANIEQTIEQIRHN